MARKSPKEGIHRVTCPVGSHSLEVAEPFTTDLEQRGGDQTCLELAGDRMVVEEADTVARDNSDNFCYKRQ